MDKLKQMFGNKSKKDYIGIAIGTALLLSYLVFFLSNSFMYSEEFDGVTYYAKKKLLLLFGILALLEILLWLNNTLSDKVNKILAIMATVLSPVVVFFCMETITESRVTSMGPIFIIANLIMIGVVLLIFLFITNSMKAAPVIVTVLMLVLAIANYFVYDFRGVPLMASDLAVAGTAADVLEDFKLVPSAQIVWAVLAALSFILLLCKLKKTKMFRLRIRLAFGAVVCALTILTVNRFVFADQFDKWGMEFRMFKPMDTYRTYGTAVTFTKSLEYVVVKKPEGYSVDAVQKIADEYKSDKAGSKDGIIRPNVITVIDEAFSDLTVLGDYKTNADPMPFFKSIKKNAITGWSYASIVGGLTANTEYEYLTGNSLAFLPSSQTVAFQMYVHHSIDSLTSNLRDLGYQGNIALHPYTGINYNRPAAYRYLGFQEYLSKDDMGFQGSYKIRRFYSDESDFDLIMSRYEEAKAKSNDPFSMYTMTMQNHIPYDMPEDENYKATIKIKGGNNKGYKWASTYLSLVNATDQALEKMIKYFEQKDDPTVIVFFGDHQPRLATRFMNDISDGTYSDWNDEEMMKRYQIPFVIWANYDIGEEHIENTSMNFLQSILVDKLGYETTGYQKFLLDFQKQVPTLTANGYYGADGKYYQVMDKTSPYYEWVHKYSILQYNNIFDVKNKIPDFFELTK